MHHTLKDKCYQKNKNLIFQCKYVFIFVISYKLEKSIENQFRETN